MHRVKPHQLVRIIQVELAVPADEPEGVISDGISAVLSGAVADSDSVVLDWRYTGEWREKVQVGDDPEEGEVFQTKRLFGK
ncbi:MAG: hypothetical protein U9R15_05815 [Chloroflexota bacterium]|nr:hypothetical protein [Chloroflexota bacterium]